MTHPPKTPNYQEIVGLTSVELHKRTKEALEAFIQAVKSGEGIKEKSRIYEAYEDERLKRLTQARHKYIQST